MKQLRTTVLAAWLVTLMVVYPWCGLDCVLGVCVGIGTYLAGHAAVTEGLKIINGEEPQRVHEEELQRVTVWHGGMDCETMKDVGDWIL